MAEIKHYRKKPVVIQAIRFLPHVTCEDLYELAGVPYEAGDEPKPKPFRFADDGIYIETPEGEMRAGLGDFIIRGVAGEIYPCKPEIFLATYDAA